MSTQTHYRVCNLCEAMCGLAIEHDGQQVISIKGDEKDPFSKGSICPKGALLGDMYNDPDRLRKPLKKTENDFVEIPWKEAFDIVGEKINAIREQYGNNAVGIYFGNPTVHNMGAMLYVAALKKSIRSQNNFTATSMDQLPHHFAAHYMFGSGMLLPIPDINRTQYMIMMGANPVASNGSIMTAAGVKERLKAIQERGGKYIVIDPRKTETAKTADEHHFILPGSDVYFLLAMLQLIIEEKKIKIGHLKNHVNGLEDLVKLISGFSLEMTAEKTGIPAAEIRRITNEYLQEEKAVIYGRMGVSVQEQGGLCNWLINLINILSSHFDREGGAMLTKPAVSLVQNKKGRKSHGRWKSRVRGLPEFEGELPVATMVEEMTTAGDGQIKALITNAGNPVLSSPNGKRLDSALADLDFMVSIDIYLNETTKHADIILPPTAGLEIDHYDFIFNHLAVSNTAKFSKALFLPKHGQLHDWQIFKALTARFSKKKMPLWYRWSTPRRLLNFALLTGPYGRFSSWKRFFSGLSLGKLIRSKHGVDLGPLVRMFPKAVMTIDGKIDLTPSPFVEGLQILKKSLSNHQSDKLSEDQFRLIGRRHLRSNNSWLHNTEKLMTGRNRCTLMMHPNDATNLSLQNKMEVEVSSRVGTVTLPLEITDQVMPGVVSIPHGFGHNKKGTRLKVAEASPGVSINDLTDETLLDPVTGNAAFSGVLVEVRAK